MKFLTSLGKMIVLIPSAIASIFAFIVINSKDSRITIFSTRNPLMHTIESIFLSVLIGMAVVIFIILSIIFLSDVHKSEFRTIYDNDRNIKVRVRTTQEEDIFAGEYLKHKIVSTSGTLKLTKHSTSINQSIDKIEFVGPNQKDSKVEKIEYSETLFSDRLFGLRLLNNFKSTHLKIHLKDSRSKEDLETEEELRDFLYGNQLNYTY